MSFLNRQRIKDVVAQPFVYDKEGRMRVFDAIRGLSMFLVVFGHVLGCFDLGGYDSFLGSVILTFRMPLFFFISGFFAYRAVGDWTFGLCRRVLAQKVRAQVLCTLLFFALYDYAFGGNNPLGWIDYGFGGYWFTIVLFQMFVVYLLLNVISRIIKHTIVNITMVAIAVLCLYILILDRPNETNRVWVMLCGENLTKYFQFFVLGIFARKYFMAFGRLLSNDSFRVAMVVGFVICMCLWYSDTLKQYDLVYRFIHDILIRYFGVMMVVSVVFAYKDYFENQHFIPQTFRLMGRRSLDIYMIHYFFLPVLPWSMEWLSNNSMISVQILLCTLVSVVVVAICLLLSSVTRTSHFLSVWLWGVRK